MGGANWLSLFSGDHVSDGVPILTHCFTNIVHLVCKNDFDGVEGVLGVLDQFGLSWGDMKQIFPAKHACLFVLLEDTLSNISMMCSTDEEILVRKVFEALALDKEFRGISNLEVRVTSMVLFRRSGNHRRLDDSRESIR